MSQVLELEKRGRRRRNQPCLEGRGILRQGFKKSQVRGFVIESTIEIYGRKRNIGRALIFRFEDGLMEGLRESLARCRQNLQLDASHSRQYLREPVQAEPTRFQ